MWSEGGAGHGGELRNTGGESPCEPSPPGRPDSITLHRVRMSQNYHAGGASAKGKRAGSSPHSRRRGKARPRLHVPGVQEQFPEQV